ncbi:PIG-L family deacetylase [Myceligenerans xiligouense]|uniref:PIG-L family deacetylase n=1 Tax=Myceligenerans xiligouense TaxID=253184 RepID=UPI001FE24882|nr:PIG-L family deacetylase [Myceligenerans xiligouense]
MRTPHPAGGGGLLAVHAHPDDETLSTGALLATWAAAGRPVTVVTCTRGERGEVLALAGTTSEGLAVLEGDGPALAAHRERELALATAALGVDQVFLDRTTPARPGGTGGRPGPFSGDRPGLPAGPAAAGDRGAGQRYEDSGMEWVRPGVAGPAADSPPTAFARVPLDEPARRLAGLIGELRPAVVATYEPGGGYGHPDHIRAHDVTVRALALLTEDDAPAIPELWQAVAPADEVRDARRALAASREARAAAVRHGMTLPDPGEPLPPFAKDDLPGRVEHVAVAPVLDRVLTAMRAHATQVQHATHAPGPGILGFYALSNGVVAPVVERETYLVSGRHRSRTTGPR